MCLVSANLARINSINIVLRITCFANLVMVGDNFDRIIERAYRSICEDRISVFDQAKINSFMADQSAKQERMIMIKLQEGAFRAHKDLWIRVLCFVFRTSLSRQAILLPHRFTNDQLCQLDRTMVLANELLLLRSLERDGKLYKDEESRINADGDQSYLEPCISLLGHILRGGHLESVVLSFPAVLGIDEKPGGAFRSPLNYSPDLSKFIKIAQMLVIQRAVSAPSVVRRNIPLIFWKRRESVSWCVAFGPPLIGLTVFARIPPKKVSNTTSLGYIMWSEEGSERASSGCSSYCPTPSSNR
jgi:hypothetical protein